MDLLAHRLNALELQATTPQPRANQRRISFTVSQATALVRISVLDDKGHPIVAVPAGATTGSSMPLDNGKLVDIIVELSGSSGNSATIATTNTDTASLSPAIPNTYTGSWYPIQYTLKTQW